MLETSGEIRLVRIIVRIKHVRITRLVVETVEGLIGAFGGSTWRVLLWLTVLYSGGGVDQHRTNVRWS
jgi:hypothetical protein